jgi:hypothetical protein
MGVEIVAVHFLARRIAIGHEVVFGVDHIDAVGEQEAHHAAFDAKVWR